MGILLYDQKRVAESLDEAGADALVVTEPSNVLYLTRYRKAPALAIVRRDKPDHPILIIPSGDIDFLLEDVASNVDVRAYGPFFRFRAHAVEFEQRESIVDSVANESRTDLSSLELLDEVLREARISGKVITDVVPKVLGQMAHASVVEQRSDLVRQLRMIKTSEEVDRLTQAAKQTEAAIVSANRKIAEGTKQEELARAFAMSVAEQGSRIRLDNISVGRGSALGNVNQADDVVRAGSVVRYDVGVIHKGYVSDMSRCFSCGEADERVTRYHQALVDGQAAALQKLRPGVEARSLFAVAVEAVRDSGMPHYDRTHVGHGIGLAGGYDPPLLSASDDTIIRPGMVLCVETPYYELGFAGLQVEDMVIVTEDGYETLTQLPRELVAL